uniref:Transmembrane protein putative n=1 Tax=Albugo laibachii Nc14 TaxID=890382 RepID=F0WN59_9STRA|nr:transmembrane protein putative [Albugo laibachii Nc14]|eukprot:CCA22748.1 transmembrane protein putative [Albugo laibachii Nc14]
MATSIERNANENTEKYEAELTGTILDQNTCMYNKSIELWSVELTSFHKHAIWSQLDTKLYRDNDIRLYRHLQSNETLPRYYMQASFQFSAELVFNALFDSTYYEQWKPIGINQTQKIVSGKGDRKSGSACDQLLHVTCELPWPFLHRDYVYQRRLRHYTNNGLESYVMVSHNVHDADIPQVNDIKRVQNYKARLLLRETDRDRCALYVEFQDDTDRSIPDYVLSVVISITLPTFFRELKTACSNYKKYQSTLNNDAQKCIPSVMVKTSNVIETKRIEHGQGSLLIMKPNKDQKDQSQPNKQHKKWSRGHSLDIVSSRPARMEHERQRTMDCLADKIEIISTDQFTVLFYEAVIGLHLTMQKGDNQIFVTKCEQDTEASIYPFYLKSGCYLVSINGTLVSELDFDDVLQRIRDSPRPMKLGFKNPIPSDDQPHITPRLIKHSKTKLKCLLTTKDTEEFITSLKPFQIETNTGAVIQRDVFLHARSRVFKSSGKYVMVTKGFVLHKINGCNFLRANFIDICAHLSKEVATLKKLSFYATDAVECLHEHLKESFFSNLSSSFSRSIPGYKRSASTQSAIGPTSFSSSSLIQTSSANDTLGSIPSTIDKHNIHSQMHRDENEQPISDELNATECLLDYSDIVITAKNFEWAWKHIQLLRIEERLFSATLLLDRMESYISKLPDENLNLIESVQTAMKEEEGALKQIRKRTQCASQALHDFNNDEGADWQFAQSYLGVSTFWKPGDNGTIWLKMDGIIEGADIFNTLAVIREIDLYRHWAPFCNNSEILSDIGRCELLAYFCLSLPLTPRDAVLHAFGVNACYEHRCVLLLGETPDSSMIDVPKMKGWNSDRIHIHGFRALIEPIEKLTTRACIVINMDPKCALPKNVINYWIKKGAGLMHYMIIKESIKIEKARREKSANEHLKRIECDPVGFYAWLQPRVREWFELHAANRLPTPFKKNTMETSREQVKCQRSIDIQPSNPSAQSIASEHITSSQLHSSQKLSSPEIRASDYSSSPRVSTSLCETKYTWVACIWDSRVWALLVLCLLFSIRPGHFWYACMVKFCFTYSSAHVRLPNLSFRTKHISEKNLQKRELCQIKQRALTCIAIAYDVMSSIAIWLWTSKFDTEKAMLGVQNSAILRKEGENFWFVTSSLFFLSLVVLIHLLGIMKV